MGEGFYTSEWTRINGATETGILLLEGNGKNLANLHPLQ